MISLKKFSLERDFINKIIHFNIYLIAGGGGGGGTLPATHVLLKK